MKKLLFITIMIFSMIGFTSTGFANTEHQDTSTTQAEDGLIDDVDNNEQPLTPNTPILQFPVMSDIHTCSKKQPVWNGTYCDESQSVKFKNALNDYKKVAPNYQVIATVGDVTNQGLDVQYQEFMSILNNESYVPPTAEKIITMGNHEFYEPRYWPKNGLTDELLVERFIQNTGVPNVYYDKWIEDYHFIVLGNEKSSQNNYALFSEEQYKWLDETLPINADSTKPIFVFLHQPIDATVYGSDRWGGGLDKRLLTILKKCPQVILFSGHSHYFLNHPRTVFQDGFTMVNTGAVEYMYYDGGAVKGQSQGLLVDVYQDRIVIKARDFVKRAWIGEYEVKVPFEKTHFDNESPKFDSKAAIKVSGITQTSASIEWGNATDNSLVERYDISLNGKLIKSEYIQFWNDPRTPKFTLPLTNLEDNTELKVEVVAVDGWKNKSLPLSVTLKTAKYSGWVMKNGDWHYYDTETGNEKEGWFLYKNNWYYLNQDGKIEKGWITDNGKRYFLDSAGIMKTGWIKTDGKWYYLNKDGSMKTGWFLDKTKWYYLNKDGIMSTGWLYTDGSWYYLNSSGAMKTGWLYTGGKWYFLNDSGSMRTGWLKESNTWYYLQPSGAMQIGRLKLNEGWYYLSGSGAMKTGWVYLGGVWYYLNNSGLWVE